MKKSRRQILYLERKGKESDQDWDLVEGKRRSQQQHPSALEEHSSGLTILIFGTPLYENKRFPPKKKKRLKSAWGIGRLLCVNTTWS